MKIRIATENDGPAISSLLALLHDDLSVAFNSNKIEQGHHSFVADQDGVAAGFALATYTRYGFTSYGMIEELIVHPEHRGSGIGKALVASCLNWLREHNIEVVFVSAVDDAAVKFYGKQHFKPCVGAWLYALLQEV